MSDETIEIAIGTNGIVEGIHKDELQDFYKKLGRVVDIQRASHVEWENKPDGKGWTVRAAHDTRLVLRDVCSGLSPWTLSADDTLPIAYFELRDDALDAERRHFWDILPGERQTKKEIK
jgi:hypothetical protein